jgi:lysophospholipase L1-like esterase
VRPRLPILVVALNLVLIFLLPLLAPLGGGLVVGFLFVALNLLALVGPPDWLAGLERSFRRNERAKLTVLLVSSLVVTAGGLEYLAGGLTTLGLLEPYSAMRTMLPAGVEDWRLAHLTADRYRQPDPELLWRPVDREPYNSQRFKGPEIGREKPAGVCRIFCYGDSNTDGPPSGGWAQLLRERLARRPDGHRYEVVNAGVTGYSSYQGRLRFARDAPRFRPDVVLVSFGWNDLAPALGAPDRSFRPPAAPLLAAQRLLLRYDFFLVARRYWPRGEAPPQTVGPRVEPADYSANLAAFIDTAAAHGGRVALLTRPHREPEPALVAQTDNWRRDVPAYNRIVRRLAGEQGAILIDVQRRFAGRPELFVDECHFTPDGQQQMAGLIERQLSRRGLLEGSATGPRGDDSSPAVTPR